VVGDLGRHRDFVQVGQRLVHRHVVLLHDFVALLAVGLLDGVLDLAMASSRGSTPEMAKKQVCMMVLMREPMPVSRATL
jgi:hypothetical protein